MKILVVMVLTVLSWSLAEGSIVLKCDLKDQLMNAIGNLKVETTQKELSGENLVAGLVCYAQLASHFNTSAVTEAPGGHTIPIWPHNRRKRNSKMLSFPAEPESFDHNPPLRESTATDPEAPTRCKRCRRVAQDMGTLYGIFQLSNRLVCSDGTTPSPTICGIACSALVDDDVRDDIRCLLKVITTAGDSGLRAYDQEELEKMIRLIFQPRCSIIKPSVYFAMCPSS